MVHSKNAQKLIRPIAIAIAVFLAALPASTTSLPAWTAPASGISIDDSGLDVGLGDVFVANANETVTALGAYANIAYTTDEDVALYDASGNMLTSTNINPSLLTPVNGYYWGAAATQLYAGQTYTVVVFTNGSMPGWGYSNTGPTDGWATFLYDDYILAAGLPATWQNPTTPGIDGSAYYGADILATASETPEPKSLFLLGSGLVAMAGFLRFRLRKN